MDWPLLLHSNSAMQLYRSGMVREWTGDLAPLLLRSPHLERADREYAAHRSIDVSELRWPPGPAERFLRMVYDAAREAGGLYFHSRSGLNLPLEALSEPEEWSASFPIVRVRHAELPRESREFPRSERRRSGAVRRAQALVYANPLGDPPLRAIRDEALALEAALSSRFQTRLVLRPLSEHELHEAIAQAQLAFYVGHGLNLGGYPAVPAMRGRSQEYAPLTPQGWAGPMPRLFVFAACLPECDQAFLSPGNTAFLYPICSIADRPCAFLPELARGLAESGATGTALARACAADAAAGDLRRFIFRLQGGAPEFGGRVSGAARTRLN